MSRPALPLRAALGLSLLLALSPVAAPLRAAGFHAASPAPSFWGAVWESIVQAACSRGLSLDPALCPAPAAAGGCDMGPAIDPDGRCKAAAAPVLSACDKGPLIDPDGRCAP
jgi:hypothetical protein